MSSGGDEYRESVGQHSTIKTAVGGAQPIKTSGKGEEASSESLASSIAQRKTGDPGAYERASADFEEGKEGGSGKGSPRDNLKRPLIVSGIVVAVIGAIIALAYKSKSDSPGGIERIERHRVE